MEVLNPCNVKTRMHSSTPHCSGRLGGGGCLPRGIYLGGVCLIGGVYLGGGVCLGGSTWIRRQTPPDPGTDTPHVDRMTDRCKNITIPQQYGKDGSNPRLHYDSWIISTDLTFCLWSIFHHNAWPNGIACTVRVEGRGHIKLFHNAGLFHSEMIAFSEFVYHYDWSWRRNDVVF